MNPERFRRFKDISVSERILNTVFLLTIGLGYLAALANLYYTHQGLDGKAGLSVEDVVISYHGSNTQTRLGTAIKGIMKPNLRYPSDQDVIMEWINSGADEPGYVEKIAPILNRDCIICHTPAVNPSLPDLTTYSGVAEVAHGGGATIPTLVRVSHIHLFGIAFILFFYRQNLFAVRNQCLPKANCGGYPVCGDVVGCGVLVHHQIDTVFCLCGGH
jgi:hypothetical protein